VDPDKLLAGSFCGYFTDCPLEAKSQTVQYPAAVFLLQQDQAKKDRPADKKQQQLKKVVDEE
jgi:hypothetical protein